ncbi:Rieske (2Fe-2S) protein [Paenibacillus agaridevorans]|nr:Rieske 2Fe-2S domain-containing protein [Paenibacillus agaridevorans]
MCAVHEIPEGARKIVEVKGMELGVFHIRGKWFAWRNVCPHAAARL